MPSILRRAAVLSLTLTFFATLPAEAVKRRAFVTSIVGTGNLNSWPGAGGAFGLAAGDNICRARAAAVPLPNAAAYRAWLSTAATDAYCHVQGLTGKKVNGCSAPPPGAGPWYRLGASLPMTGTLDELTGDERAIFLSVRYDEFGAVVDEGERYYTGTGATGEAVEQLCSSWVVAAPDVLGRYGRPDATTLHWTTMQNLTCDTPGHLLCLEPGVSETTAVVWSPAALAFVTSTYGDGDLSGWPHAGGETGLAAGDAICQNLAAEAHLPAPESFVAWLSTPATDAKDRLTLNATPWRRVDGYLFAASKAGLLASGTATSLHVDETGSYLPFVPATWTGTTESGVDAGHHCEGWSRGDSGDTGEIGYASFGVHPYWSDATYVGCNQNGRLYCFSNVVTLFWDGFELTEDLSRWSSSTP